MTNAQSPRFYLLTPPLREAEISSFAAIMAGVLEIGGVACVLARLAPGAGGDAKKIVSQLLQVAAPADAALLVDDDPRLAARVGADGAHISQGETALREALASLKPERIVGAGLLRNRDEAMTAGEAGADYLMFGEPRRDGFTPPIADTVERVAWWAEIFEPPCVGYAASLDHVPPLLAAGADFVALADAIWNAEAPVKAMAQARAFVTSVSD
jgi:thiamine-phosphate pyrophosphorylase